MCVCWYGRLSERSGCRYEPTDEVFFVQNAGAPAAGTGLNKSAIIQKISLAQADAVTNTTNATGLVTVSVVPSNPTVINPNGTYALEQKKKQPPPPPPRAHQA